MRIRLANDIVPTKLNKQNKATIQSRFYSAQGIYRLSKSGALMRLKIIDEPVQSISLDNMEMHCDKSRVVDDEEWYQLPFDHLCDKTIRKKFMLRPCGPVALFVEESEDGGLKDAYFETELTPQEAVDDIRAFLSLKQIQK